MGEAQPRQVVSGLVKFMSEAQMRGQRVVVVANMKPANMRGVESHAMVLCATSADGSKVRATEGGHIEFGAYSSPTWQTAV